MTTNQPETTGPAKWNEQLHYRCPECDTYSGTYTPQWSDEMLHSICGRIGSVASFIRGTPEFAAVYDHQEVDDEESQPEILRNLRRGLADFEIEHPNHFDDDDKVALARVRLLIQAVEEQS